MSKIKCNYRAQERRARRMKKRWPWANSESYLDRPLADIRREFGIEVFG